MRLLATQLGMNVSNMVRLGVALVRDEHEAGTLTTRTGQ